MDTSNIKPHLEGLLASMGITATVTEGTAAGHVVYSVTTDDSKLLIGREGETLRALNLVVRRAFEDKLPEEALKFRIDVNGYYADREGRIVREARQLAERARLFKYDVDMRPLNPYERMIVHEALKDFGDIVTESRGEGMDRHIVLVYRPGGAEAAPAPSTEQQS